MKKIFSVLSLFSVIAPQTVWGAPGLITDAENRLVGATGISVGGTLYNVAFADESCVNLFAGCDSAADFLFQTAESATQASQALLDQVFPTAPSVPFASQLRAPCDYSPQSWCSILTPFSYDGTHVVTSTMNYNNPGFKDDGPVLLNWNPASNYTNPDAANIAFAVWSRVEEEPVSEPALLGILSFGLLILGVSRRRPTA